VRAQNRQHAALARLSASGPTCTLGAWKRTLVIVHVWEAIKLHGNDQPNRKLKQSFSEMVPHADMPLSAAEIATRSKIPDFLADYYASCGPFFVDLRNYRNKFLHHGERADRIYVSERGFSVGKDAQPFAKWNVWDQESTESNVASLRPVLRYIIANTLSAFTGFAELMLRKIQFPPPTAPGTPSSSAMRTTLPCCALYRRMRIGGIAAR
jgi:hypothetical protein